MFSQLPPHLGFLLVNTSVNIILRSWLLELDENPQVWAGQQRVKQNYQLLSSGPCASVNAVRLDTGAFSSHITLWTHVYLLNKNFRCFSCVKLLNHGYHFFLEHLLQSSE